MRLPFCYPWPQVLFSNNTNRHEKAMFQICPVMLGGKTKQDPVMMVGAFHFGPSKVHGIRYLWWNYKSSDIKFYQSVTAYTFNTKVYAYARNDVLEKLGKNIVDYVGALDIDI